MKALGLQAGIDDDKFWSTRTTSAVMTSPARISWRERLSSNRAAKLSFGCYGSVEVAVDIGTYTVADGSNVEKTAPAALVRRIATRHAMIGRLALSEATSDRGTIGNKSRARAMCQHGIDRLVDRHIGGIEQRRIGALLQGRHAARGIARIAFLQVLQKGAHVSRQSLFDQLFISALGTRLGAAVRNTLSAASGKTTEPMSRPSATRPGARRKAR